MFSPQIWTKTYFSDKETNEHGFILNELFFSVEIALTRLTESFGHFEFYRHFLPLLVERVNVNRIETTFGIEIIELRDFLQNKFAFKPSIPFSFLEKYSFF